MSRPTDTRFGNGIAFGGVRTVMVFADDPERSARWWASVLGTEVHIDVDGASVYAWLEVGDIELGFHPADPVNNPPRASPVVAPAANALRPHDGLVGRDEPEASAQTRTGQAKASVAGVRGVPHPGRLQLSK